MRKQTNSNVGKAFATGMTKTTFKIIKTNQYANGARRGHPHSCVSGHEILETSLLSKQPDHVIFNMV